MYDVDCLSSFFDREVNVWIHGKALAGILRRTHGTAQTVHLLPSDYWTSEVLGESIINVAAIDAVTLLLHNKEVKDETK